MHKAGGIIGLIAGVFGFLAAIFTLFAGGIGSAFGAKEAEGIVGLGLGGVFFSFLTIIFAAVVFSKPKGAGIGLIVSAVLGSIFGGTFVAVCMVLAAIGGLLAVLDNSTVKQPQMTSTTVNISNIDVNETVATPPSRLVNRDSNQLIEKQTVRQPWVLPVLIGLLVVLFITIIVGAQNAKKSKKTTGNSDSIRVDQVGTIQTKTASPLDELTEKTPDNSNAEILVGCWKSMHMGTLAEKKECGDNLANGKVVQWFLDVGNVELEKDGYIVHASAALGIPVTVHIRPRNDADKSLLESLNTADSIAFKGVLDTSNNDDTVVVNPAILVPKPVKSSSESAVQTTVKQQSNVSNEVVAPTTTKGHSAFVYKPPSNVRDSPNGNVLCSINEPTNITVYEYAGSTYDSSREVKWYYTDACGSIGVIAYSQFR